MAGPDPPAALPPALAIYAVVSHEAALQVLRDAATFSSRGYAMTTGAVMGRTILEMDAPDHARYRGLLQQAFTKKALAYWEDTTLRPLARRLVDAFARRGRAELVRELTFPFPMSVIAEMMGIPNEHRARFHRLAVELISVGFDAKRAQRAAAELGADFLQLVEARRIAPGPDLVSRLVEAELDGGRLRDDDILSFLRLLLPAGAETTYRSTSNLLCALLTQPDQLHALRADRSRMDAAIEEGLRWEAPLSTILRVSVRETEVCGVAIPAGAIVVVILAAANHDPARWERPHEFDLHRPAQPHLAFAFGPHRCMGMHLARLETRVMLETLLDRLQDLRLDPEAEDVHVSGELFRAPRALPVVFTPEAA